MNLILDSLTFLHHIMEFNILKAGIVFYRLQHLLNISRVLQSYYNWSETIIKRCWKYYLREKMKKCRKMTYIWHCLTCLRETFIFSKIIKCQSVGKKFGDYLILRIFYPFEHKWKKSTLKMKFCLCLNSVGGRSRTYKDG